jgi:tripartite-type tricarboxylate transporter receptor subunit TctC
MTSVKAKVVRGASTLVLLSVLSPSAALAQSYPSKPIRLLVPVAAGTTPDVVARVVAQGLSQAVGQPIIVDNRSGAAGTIGLEVAAKSVPDGYTIVLGTTGTLASAPGLYPNLRYDPIKSFVPISLLVTAPYVVAVHPSVASTLRDLIDRAKARPGQLHFGSGGSGGPPHIAGEMFKAAAQVNLTHVPYKSSTAAVSDLIAGRLQVLFNQLVNFQSHAQAGKLTILCVAGPKRLVQLPNVPTAAEAGLHGYAVSIWFGLIAPRGVPQPILARLNAETLKALASKDVQDALLVQGFEPTGSTPGEFAALIAAESAKWLKAIRESGAKLD